MSENRMGHTIQHIQSLQPHAQHSQHLQPSPLHSSPTVFGSMCYRNTADYNSMYINTTPTNQYPHVYHGQYNVYNSNINTPKTAPPDSTQYK